MKQCVVCVEEVTEIDERVKDTRKEAAAQADTLGMESLTEQEQALVEGAVYCSEECYYKQ